MQFGNPIVNQLVIYGSGDNLPDVTIGPSPLIVFYDGVSPIIKLGLAANSPTSTGPAFVLQDAAATSKVIIDRDVSGFSYVQAQNSTGIFIRITADLAPSIDFGLAGLPGIASLVYHDSGFRTTFQLVYVGKIAGVVSTFSLTEDATTGAAQYETTRHAPIIPTVEVWNNFALQNGWTTVGVTAFDAPSYRLMPDGTCRIRGVAANGVNANGTTVFNLPGTYRPVKRKQFPITLNAGTALTAVCQIMEIGSPTAGDVKIYGVPAANAIGFDEITFGLGELI